MTTAPVVSAETPAVAGYRPHPLHAPERDWTEVNCYIDLWIELLHWLGRDPVPALCCALNADVDGDQWTFLKPDPEDLRILYGIEVRELNIWRSVLEHVGDQLDRGRLMTVEVDSWFLPDTRGRAYQMAHEKTTIVPHSLNVEDKRLSYFHGPGLFELRGADFDGLFAPALLPPYAETIVLDPAMNPGNVEELATRALLLTADHLRRAPATNPVRTLAAEIEAKLGWLAGQDPSAFHAFAFGTARQCGGTAELAADLARWLHDHAAVETFGADGDFRAVSTDAKALQFTMARAARGRRTDLSGVLDRMADSWDAGLAKLRSALLT